MQAAGNVYYFVFRPDDRYISNQHCFEALFSCGVKNVLEYGDRKSNVVGVIVKEYVLIGM